MVHGEHKPEIKLVEVRTPYDVTSGSPRAASLYDFRVGAETVTVEVHLAAVRTRDRLGGFRDNDWTKILGWPGYRVYRAEIHEAAKALKLWVRRKPGNRRIVCSGCGRRLSEIREVYEREVRDLACFDYPTTVVLERYRVRCPDCGVKAEKVEQLPSQAPFSKRFEEAVGQACESAAARQVAKRLGLASSTVRAMDLRYLERWAAGRRKPALRQMGVDEIYLGKKPKFLTVVSTLR